METMFVLFLRRIREMADRGVGVVTVGDYSPPAHEKREPYRHATLNVTRDAAAHLIEAANLAAETKAYLSFYGRDQTMTVSMSRNLTDEECYAMNAGTTYREVA